MFTPEVLLTFLVAVLVIMVAPGPDMAFVVASGVSTGWRGGVIAAVGITLGVSVHVVLAALGLGALLQAFPALGDLIRFAGAGYLAYLAIITWRAAGPSTVDAESDSEKSMTSIFWRGMIVNLTNPKIILFFGAFLSQFVDPDRGSVALQFLILGLMFQAVGLAVDTAVGVAAGAVRDVFTRKPYLHKVLDRIAATVFAVLAAALLVEVLL
jgi:threonine/homoserine/homoserine lactone efflux protein